MGNGMLRALSLAFVLLAAPFAAAAQTLYWLGEHDFYQWTAGGEEPRAVATCRDAGGPDCHWRGIALDAERGRLYWCMDRDAVHVTDLASGESEVLMPLEGMGQLVLDDVASELWVNDLGRPWLRTPLAEFAPAPAPVPAERGLVTPHPHGASVYLVTGGPQGSIRRLTPTDGRIEMLQDDLYYPGGLRVDDDAGLIFWTQGEGKKPESIGIRVMKLDGSEARDIVRTAPAWPTGLALDRSARQVYWLERHGRGGIVRAGYDGANVEVVRAGVDGWGLWLQPVEREAGRSAARRERRAPRFEHCREVSVRLPPGVTELEPNEQGCRVFLRVADGQRMVLVPGQRFDTREHEGLYQTPAHEADVPTLLVDETEITRGQLGGEGGNAGANQPATSVSFVRARNYCQGVGARLPTDDEWLLALGRADGRKYPWGSEWPPPAGAANIADEALKRAEPDWEHWFHGYDDGAGGPAPVGSFRAGASPTGVLDLVGNVYEILADPPPEHPKNSRAKGGSYHAYPHMQPELAFIAGDPNGAARDEGFRCVMDVLED